MFTSYACAFTFALEQDANVENSYKFPVLYNAGQKAKYFNIKVFWKWIIFACWHAICSFYGPLILASGPIDSSGVTQFHWFGSTSSFGIIISFVTLKLFTESAFELISFTAAIVSIVYFALFIISVPFAASMMQA
ncbi:MAG: hypothetical protein IPK55_13720 [Streptococcus sp.]|nr:hypothetical protein [Streptococcus sp.]